MAIAPLFNVETVGGIGILEAFLNGGETLDCWLASNQRAAKWTCGVTFIFALCAFLFASGGMGIGGHVWWVFRVAAGLAGVFLVSVFAVFLVSMRRPRVAFFDGHLQLELGAAAPFRLPLDVVECFFLGQGPSFVGKGKVAESDASNVVVRLAERATEWHKREVRPTLGHWCDGYITIRGAWCEPIDGQVVERMNSRLAAVKRERKAVAASSDSAKLADAN